MDLSLGLRNAHCPYRAQLDTSTAVRAFFVVDIHPGLVDSNAVSGAHCNTASAQHTLVVFQFHHISPNHKSRFIIKRFGMFVLGMGV